MRRSLQHLVGLNLALFWLVTTAAAAPPTLQIDDTTFNGRPDARTNTNIERYVDYWFERLDGDDLSGCTNAATKLLKPPARRTSTASFRAAYENLLLDNLKDAIDNGNDLKAVQAMRIVAHLGTADALETAAEHVDSEDESRLMVRIWAARAAAMNIRQSIEDDSINENQIALELRNIANAGRTETHWLVLHRIFDALAADGSATGRTEQLSLFEEVLVNMDGEETVSREMMWTVTQQMVSLRDQFLTMAAEERLTFQRQIVPAVAGVLRVAESHWEDGQADSKTRRAVSHAMTIAESLLKTCDRSVRGTTQSTKLAGAWEDSDRTLFENHVEEWTNLADSDSYRH